MRVPLSHLAHVRASGASLVVLAWGEAEYAILARELTVDRLRAFLSSGAPERIERHDLPRLHCLIFVLASPPRLDPGRPMLAGRLLHLEIDKEPQLI